jgi:aspartokinase-like uncharacterized kinase
MIVLKIGGSLFEHAPDILRRITATSADVLIVPGGGLFADVVRKIYGEHGLSEDAAHWMAVLAMDEYAYYLSDKTGIPLTPMLVKKKGIRIILPYEILRRSDDLPHSWEVTSDTIAAWMALRTNSKLIKATDVDGVIMDGRIQESVDASKLQGLETCVDGALPGFLIDNRMDALVVNGLIVPRIENAILGKPAVGTIINGK